MEAVELGEAAAEGGDGSPATPALTRQRSAHGAEYEVLLAKGVPRHMLSRAWVVCAGDAADAEMYIRQNADQPPSFWRVPSSDDATESCEDADGRKLAEAADGALPAAQVGAAAATPRQGRRWSLVRTALLAAADRTADVMLAEDPVARTDGHHGPTPTPDLTTPGLEAPRLDTPDAADPGVLAFDRRSRSVPLSPLGHPIPKDLDLSLLSASTPQKKHASAVSTSQVKFAVEPLFGCLQQVERALPTSSVQFLQQLAAGDQVDVNIGSLRRQIVALSETITASQGRGTTPSQEQCRKTERYAVGNQVEVFSKSAGAWSDGVVTAVDTRRNTVTVRYRKPDGRTDMQKTTQQDSPHIRPAETAAPGTGGGMGEAAEGSETSDGNAETSTQKPKSGERRDVKLSRGRDGRFGVAFHRGGAPGGGVLLADTSAEAAAAGMVVGCRIVAVNGAEIGFSSDLTYELDRLDRMFAKNVTFTVIHPDVPALGDASDTAEEERWIRAEIISTAGLHKLDTVPETDCLSPGDKAESVDETIGEGVPPVHELGCTAASEGVPPTEPAPELEVDLELNPEPEPEPEPKKQADSESKVRSAAPWQLKVGARVQVIEDVEKAMVLAEKHGGWSESMASYCGTEGTVIKLHVKAGKGHQPTVQVMHLDGRCWYWNGLCLRAPSVGSPQVRLWLPVLEMKELDKIISAVALQAGAGRRHERELQAITRRGVPFEVALEENIKPVGSRASAVAVGDELEVHVLCRPHRPELHPKSQAAIDAGEFDAPKWVRGMVAAEYSWLEGARLLSISVDQEDAIEADSEEDECLTQDVEAYAVKEESDTGAMLSTQLPMRHKKMKPYAPHRRPHRRIQKRAPRTRLGAPPHRARTPPPRRKSPAVPKRATTAVPRRTPPRTPLPEGTPGTPDPQPQLELELEPEPETETEPWETETEPEPEPAPVPDPEPWVWRPIVMDPELVSTLSGNDNQESTAREVEPQLSDKVSTRQPGFTCGMSNAVLFRPADAPSSSPPIALVVEDSILSSARFLNARTVAKDHPELLVGQRCVIHDDRGRRNVQIRAYVPELKNFVTGHPNFGTQLSEPLSVIDLMNEDFTVEPSRLPIATLAAATESVGTFTHECVVCMRTRSRRQMADFCFTSYRVGAHDEDTGEPRHKPQVCEACMKLHVQSYLSEGKLAVRCPVEGCGRSLQTRELRKHATLDAYEQLIKRLREADEAHANADSAVAAAQGAAAGLELRTCPACGVLIEKNKGCMTMRCYRCDTHFAWAEAKTPLQDGVGGARRRWGPPVPVDEHGTPEQLTLRQSGGLWLRWFVKCFISVAKVLCLLMVLFKVCGWVWSLGWRKIMWGLEATGTVFILGTILWKLHMDWRHADPDPLFRRRWTRRERLQRHFRAFRGRITEGLPQDPRRFVDFMRLVTSLLPTFIKLLWLQRMFYWSDFLHPTPVSGASQALVLDDSTISKPLPSPVLPDQEAALSPDGFGTDVMRVASVACGPLPQCPSGGDEPMCSNTDNDGGALTVGTGVVAAAAAEAVAVASDKNALLLIAVLIAVLLAWARLAYRARH